jgi:hypothetical protein
LGLDEDAAGKEVRSKLSQTFDITAAITVMYNAFACFYDIEKTDAETDFLNNLGSNRQ